MIATRADDVGQVQEMTKTEPLGDAQLLRLIGGKKGNDVPAQMRQHVGVFRIKGDPHDNADRLREAGIDASPIHALGTLNHISWMTGTDPRPAKVKNEPVIAGSSPGRVVAAIDTGVTQTLPAWLDSGLEYEHADTETLSGKTKASHGTFVAGLIRRVAPEHTISMARARRVPVKDLEPKLDRSHLDAEDPSTELHVLEAMIRLVNRLGDRDRCDVAALNLSLGGSCDDHDPGFVTMRIALDLWRNAFPRAPIFAAGGNSPDAHVVYPGGFEFVRSVASANGKGELVVWHQPSSRSRTVTTSDRPWITDVAPGSDLVSPSGRTKSEWVKWSGSSFATAVATASYVSRRTMEAHGGLVWWADRQTKASDIPGLVL